MASALISKEADDGAQTGALLGQITGPMASVTGDGTYDQDAVYAAVAERHPAAVIVPPRTTAVPSGTADIAPTERDHHFQSITANGRMAWQQATGYNKRAKAEAAIGRWKQVRLLLGSGVLASLSHQGCDEGAQEGFAAAPGVVHELEEAEIERQLLLRDAPVRAEPGAQQGPRPLHGVDVDLEKPSPSSSRAYSPRP